MQEYIYVHTLTQTDKHTLSVLENEPPPADGANNAPCLLPAHIFLLFSPPLRSMSYACVPL